MLASLQTHFGRMLALDGLAQTFVTTVDNIAEGATPARHLAALAPDRSFSPGTAGEAFVFSEENAGRDRIDDRYKITNKTKNILKIKRIIS